MIGISGKARAGKDLLASFTIKDGWHRLSFADALKLKVKSEFALEEAHVNGALKEVQLESLNGHSPRELMIDYGNFRRKYDPDFWVKAIASHIESHSEFNYVITDCRFINEIEMVRNHGGYLVRLERHPSRDSMVSSETQASPSETALDKYAKFDFILAAELNETPSQLASFWEVIKAVINVKL